MIQRPEVTGNPYLCLDFYDLKYQLQIPEARGRIPVVRCRGPDTEKIDGVRGRLGDWVTAGRKE